MPGPGETGIIELDKDHELATRLMYDEAHNPERREDSPEEG